VQLSDSEHLGRFPARRPEPSPLPAATDGRRGILRGRPEARPPANRSAPLLDLDPELGRALSPENRELARRQIPVRVGRLGPGPWTPQGSYEAAGHLGLLVLDGLLGRELLADGAAGLELLGPGDLVRPWEEPTDTLLHTAVRWSALAEMRFAVLDAQVAARLSGFPEIYAELLSRCAARARRLAVTQVICQLNRVDRRILALLWHLAERGGKVTPAGIAVPLALSHRLLAQLVGARRPTVSTALAQLARAGELSRGADGTWLLTGEPVGPPDLHATRFVMPRRRTLAPHRAAQLH
jgi:CRP/FNR family transcriptional regulator, cyclic AMP receptor protein